MPGLGTAMLVAKRSVTSGISRGSCTRHAFMLRRLYHTLARVVTLFTHDYGAAREMDVTLREPERPLAIGTIDSTDR